MFGNKEGTGMEASQNRATSLPRGSALKRKLPEDLNDDPPASKVKRNFVMEVQPFLAFRTWRQRTTDTFRPSEAELGEFTKQFPGAKWAMEKLRRFADEFPKNGTELRMQDILDAELCVLELDHNGNPVHQHQPDTLNESVKSKYINFLGSRPMPPGHFIPRMWPTNIVHYSIDDNFTDTQKFLIRRAINEFHEKTYIRLVPRTFQKDYIHIRHVVGACYSKLGFIGGKQEICLSDKGVNRRGTILHEIMHALGFDHEHSRPDRDKHVFINWCNISNGFEPQFKTRYGFLSENGRYDYGSVMHYPAHAFADLKLLPTIIPTDKNIGQRGIGQRLWLSPDDCYKINAAYKSRVCQKCSMMTSSTSCFDSPGPNVSCSCPHPITESDVLQRMENFDARQEKLRYRMVYKPIVEEVCEPNYSIRKQVVTKNWAKSRKTKQKLEEVKQKWGGGWVEFMRADENNAAGNNKTAGVESTKGRAVEKPTTEVKTLVKVAAYAKSTQSCTGESEIRFE